MSNLKDETKVALIDSLTDMRVGAMFGDGQEEDYVRDGFPKITGLNEMSDDALVDEYASNVDDDDELLIKAKSELKEKEEDEPEDDE